MAENGAHFSGEGHLIEAVILGDPNKTVIPVVCDSEGRLVVDVDGTGSPIAINLTEIGGMPYSLGQTTSSNSAPVVIASNQSTIPVSIEPSATANFDYVSGSLTGAGTVEAIGICRGIRVFAVSTDSSFTIQGSTPTTLQTIIVRSNQIFQIIPQGSLIDPVITWVSGSIDVWMEVDNAFIPPENGDLGLSLGIAHLSL